MQKFRLAAVFCEVIETYCTFVCVMHMLLVFDLTVPFSFKMTLVGLALGREL